MIAIAIEDACAADACPAWVLESRRERIGSLQPIRAVLGQLLADYELFELSESPTASLAADPALPQ